MRYLTCYSILIILLFSCTSGEPQNVNSVLIENISIVDPLSGLIPNQNIIIENGKIVSVEKSKKDKLVQGREIIDGTGKFLLPGLWDAHVHFAYMENLAPRMFDLFLLHGVTSVRDTGGKLDFVKEWKERSDNNPTTAPRVMIAGPLLDGMPNVYDGSSPARPPLSVGLDTKESIQSQVDLLVREGVDLLKSYEMLTPVQFESIMKLGKENNLKVTGHVPLSMDVITASNFGLNSMEHLRNLELSCASNSEELLEQRRKLLYNGKSDPGGILRSRIHNAQQQNAIENYDEENANRVLEALKRNDTWQIPTLALNNGGIDKPFARTDFQESFNLLPDSVESRWKGSIEDFVSKPADQFKEKYANWKNEMVLKIHQKGIPIMAGTDCPIFYLTPGLSLHEELAVLVDAGMSPLEVIKSATFLPAKYFELDNELGLIKENYFADLLILNENPLENIRNTTSIEMVIKHGKIFNREELDQVRLKLEKN